MIPFLEKNACIYYKSFYVNKFFPKTLNTFNDLTFPSLPRNSVYGERILEFE